MRLTFAPSPGASGLAQQAHSVEVVGLHTVGVIGHIDDPVVWGEDARTHAGGMQ
jgi:hypothetical protein